MLILFKVAKAALSGLVTVLLLAGPLLQISAQGEPPPAPNYEKMSAEEIQKMLLKDVPLGSSSDTVRAWLKKKTGKDPGIDTNFSMDEKNPVEGAKPPYVEKHYDGLTVAVIGSYGFLFFYTNVVTKWEFDSHFRLIKLTVSKEGGDMP